MQKGELFKKEKILGEEELKCKKPFYYFRIEGLFEERRGFEPPIRFPAYTLSRRAPSTTRAPLRREASAKIQNLWKRECFLEKTFTFFYAFLRICSKKSHIWLGNSLRSLNSPAPFIHSPPSIVITSPLT